MNKFVKRALKKFKKLDREQIRSLLEDIASEHERLEIVLDSMTDGILVSDTEHRLLLTNKPAERLLPLLRNESSGEPFVWQSIADQDVAEFIRTSLENNDSVNEYEFTVSNGGTDRILSVSITPLVHSGRIEGNIVLVKDVSEKRAREARLRRAESLASLTTLAAGVAHEIKNPLGSIGIHLQLANKALSGESRVEPESIRQYLSVIEEEVDRLNRIVVDFLFAVRPMDVNPVDACLNDVIEDLTEFVKPELEQNGISLELELAEDLPRLELDEKYLKQAMLNLVKNAIAAMPNGGTLRIVSETHDDEVILRICDTGVGMSEEVMNKIFEPYFTTRDSGSGIGLTLVYKIIREHYGDITVSSQEGHGTTFSISLPVPQRETHLIGWEGGDTT